MRPLCRERFHKRTLLKILLQIYSVKTASSDFRIFLLLWFEHLYIINRTLARYLPAGMPQCLSMSGVRSGRRKRRGTFPLASFVKYTILFIDCFSIMFFVGILYLHFMPNLVKYWPKCGHIKVRQPGFGVGIKQNLGNTVTFTYSAIQFPL